MTNAKDHVMENKAMYIVSTALIAILTGSGFALDFPENNSEKFEKDIQEIRLEISQNYNQREQQWQQQNNYHRQQEIQYIDSELRRISVEINRMNQLPQYLKRPLNSEESWQVEQLKIDWNLLKQRRNEISN